ncbi:MULTISPECIES: hypothetical protein [Mycobacterium]|uniref:Toxin n=1 Tax=Mycobacterium ostraviense TaxID=2738409 RepID=A0A164AHF2_9MYCO|nr:MULTISPECIES: hypothetical protein [Mycobacterium]ARG55574.1 hypothetical protein B1T43_06505 [Mycobacterium kansasii]KZS62480.1 hypothetical protein A4G28_20815 [Mycobacterium ostraviense]UGT90197.1 hypothetical protein LTS72_17740 [Mycobacterium ostraviense]
MEIRDSARKWGVPDADMLHAVDNAIVVISRGYQGDEQWLIIGPARNGALLEIVVPADPPERIIHAMPLRASFYHYLPTIPPQ